MTSIDTMGILMIGIGRPRWLTSYYPQWEDDKHRQALASACRRAFGRDLSDEILNETRNRQQRTVSPTKGPQPWPDAEAKVWRDLARRRGADAAEVESLEALVRNRYRDRRLDRPSTAKKPNG